MPLIHVTTSAEAPAGDARDALLGELSRALSEHVGKPEKWVMTCLTPRAAMTFGGTTEPVCYVEVKNIGSFTPEQTERMSADFCARLSKALGVAPERIYIEYTNAVGHLWGWNGTTFG